jgi:hypothetical protein
MVSVAPCDAQETVLLRFRGAEGQVQRWRAATVLAISRDPAVGMHDSVGWTPELRTVSFWTRTVVAVAGDTVSMVDVQDSSVIEVPGASGQVSTRRMTRDQLAILRTVDSRGRVISMQVRFPTVLRNGIGDSIRDGLSQQESGSANGWFPEHAVHVGETWLEPTEPPGASSTRHLRVWQLDGIEVRHERRVAVLSVSDVDSGRVPDDASRSMSRYEVDLTNGWITRAWRTSTGFRDGSRGAERWRWDFLMEEAEISPPLLR